MKKVALGTGGLTVSVQGLGCMELGLTFFDTADIYGPFTNEILGIGFVAYSPQELAAAKGCTPGQLALAWTLAQPGVVPIPGTKRRSYLEENAGATKVVLSAADLRAIDSVVPSGAAAGLRYPEAFMPKQTPPLPS